MSTNRAKPQQLPMAQKRVSSDQNPSDGGSPKLRPTKRDKHKCGKGKSLVLKPCKKDRELVDS